MILKRTMTRKSILGFGAFDLRDLSVQMIIDLGKEHILTSAYFNLDKIDFIEDVLLELGITDEYRIPKPGKDYEMRKKFYSDLYNSKSDIDKIKQYSKTTKDIKMDSIRARNRSKGNSAEYLRKKNHGNKY